MQPIRWVKTMTSHKPGLPKPVLKWILCAFIAYLVIAFVFLRDEANGQMYQNIPHIYFADCNWVVYDSVISMDPKWNNDTVTQFRCDAIADSADQKGQDRIGIDSIHIWHNIPYDYKGRTFIRAEDVSKGHGLVAGAYRPDSTNPKPIVVDTNYYVNTERVQVFSVNDSANVWIEMFVIVLDGQVKGFFSTEHYKPVLLPHPPNVRTHRTVHKWQWQTDTSIVSIVRRMPHFEYTGQDTTFVIDTVGKVAVEWTDSTVMDTGVGR